MEAVNCKLCNSADTIKFGIQADTQMYFCKACRRKFKGDDSLFGGRVSAGDRNWTQSVHRPASLFCDNISQD
jgi:hypothetical protein